MEFSAIQPPHIKLAFNLRGENSVHLKVGGGQPIPLTGRNRSNRWHGRGHQALASGYRDGP